MLKKTMDKLELHQVPITWLAKTETLTESPDIYREKVKQGKRNPAALYSMNWPLDPAVRTGQAINSLIM